MNYFINQLYKHAIFIIYFTIIKNIKPTEILSVGSSESKYLIHYTFRMFLFIRTFNLLKYQTSM